MIVWIAVMGAASILPAIPLVGGGTFGLQEFIIPVAPLLFGTVAGVVAVTLGEILASFIGPATAYLGLFTFLPYFLGALVTGLLVDGRRKTQVAALAVYAVLQIAWGFTAIGAYVYAANAYWLMQITAVVGIAVAPWCVKWCRTLNPGKAAVGIAILAWTAYMVEHIAVSIGYSILYPEPGVSWLYAFFTGIVPAQRLVLTVGTIIVGTGLYLGLHAAGIRFSKNSRGLLAEED